MSIARPVFLGALSLFVLLFLYLILTLPDTAKLRRQNPVTSAFMERHNGPSVQIWVPYSQISPSLKEAVVLAEDARFFSHHGFDLRAIWEAVEQNWKKREWKRGGSTLTQQLAKNLYLSPSKNPLRKIREIFIAWRLERHLSKQRIFELYLNVVEWGEGIYGCEAASRHYFGISSGELNPSQSAQLAAILPSPRYFQKHLESPFLWQKVDLLLKRMGY